jgi:O-antigen/teichoic acid export membrane protein
MSPLARIVGLSAAFLCSNLARAGIGVGLALVLGRGLGADRFGAWILCTTWASTLTIVADLGFGVLLTRDGARDDSDSVRLLAGALTWRLALVLPLGCTLMAAAGLLSSDPETIAALRVASLLGAAGAAYGCFGALLRSQPSWLPVVLAVETAWLAVQVAASWWLVARGRGLVALVTLAATLQLAQIASALALWRPVFGTRVAPALASPPGLVPLLRRAWPFAISGIVANLHTRVGPLMLGVLATPSDLGWFGAAARVGRAAKLAPQAIFAGALPVLSREYGRDRTEAQRVSQLLDRALAALSAAVAIACALAAPLLMRLLYGPQFAAAAPTLVWVAIGLIPALSNSGRKIFLYAAGGEALVVKWSAVALLLQAVSGALLIPSLGSTGAAISLAISEGAIWLPLRRADPRKVRLKANATYAEVASVRGVRLQPDQSVRGVRLQPDQSVRGVRL